MAVPIRTMVMVVAPSVMVVMPPVVMMSPAAMMMVVVMVTAMTVLRLGLAHIQSAQPQSEHGGER